MGIGAAIAAVADSLAGAATAVGVGDATAAAIGAGLTDAGIGAGLGAAESAITGEIRLPGPRQEVLQGDWSGVSALL